MSRKLFAFLLTELVFVRIICKKCEGVTETRLTKLHERFTGQQVLCPLCKHPFTVNVGEGPFDNPFIALAYATTKLNEFSNFFEVEFVIPEV